MPARLKHLQKEAEAGRNVEEFRQLTAQSQSTATIGSAIGAAATYSVAEALKGMGVPLTQNTVDNAMFTAAKNVSNLPRNNPEFDRIRAILGAPGTRVVGSNGNIVDASMTRATKGHRAYNNGIGGNVPPAVSVESGLAAARRSTGGDSARAASRHQTPFDVSPLPGWTSTTTQAAMPMAGLTNDAHWKSPPAPDFNVSEMAQDPVAVQEQRNMNSFQHGAKPAATPTFVPQQEVFTCKLMMS